MAVTVTGPLVIEHCPYCATFAARACTSRAADATLGWHVLAQHRVALALTLAGVLGPDGLRPATEDVTFPAPWRLRRDWL